MATVPMSTNVAVENSRAGGAGISDMESAANLGTRVQSALTESPLMALRHLVAEPTDGRIVISGRVSSFYQKQQAQELVRAEAPGIVVVNEVEVG